MGDIKLTIDNIEVTVPEGSTLLDAAHAAGIDIPTLCYLRDVNEIGACRMCLCEVEGARGLVTACAFPVSDGMVAHTNTERLRESRRKTLQLIVSDHNMDCLACVRNNNCELQKLCKRYGVTDTDYYAGKKNSFSVDTSSKSIVRDNNKCILCRRCVGACENLQGIGVIGANNRGFDTYIGSTFDLPLAETSCVNCGQCVAACPVGALYEKDSTAEVKAALEDPDKFVVVQAAPSVRVGLGECFGLPIGTVVEGQMSAALHRLGFDRVFDTNFSADLTILEEAHELIDRVQNGGALPLITSCSPGWVKYCEHYYPDLLPNVSSCKSPQQMFGAVVKTYYAETMGIPVDKIVSVSVMPCTAKKFECDRPDQDAAGVQDVDYSLTTRELGSLINEAGIDFVNLPEMPYDSPLGLHRCGSHLRCNRRRYGSGTENGSGDHYRRRAGMRRIYGCSWRRRCEGSILQRWRPGSERGSSQRSGQCEEGSGCNPFRREELHIRGNHGMSGRMRQRWRTANRGFLCPKLRRRSCTSCKGTVRAGQEQAAA